MIFAVIILSLALCGALYYIHLLRKHIEQTHAEYIKKLILAGLAGYFISTLFPFSKRDTKLPKK
jgi:hypothetical protein